MSSKHHLTVYGNVPPFPVISATSRPSHAVVVYYVDSIYARYPLTRLVLP